jgi:predicted esterase
MVTRLVALHGFTMNGAGLRHMLADVEPRLVDLVEFVYPDAPHSASPESVAGITSLLGGPRAKPPNLEWWNASEDGTTYHGWEASRAAVQAALAPLDSADRCDAPRVGLLGFSQGAAVAATLAALAERGGFPRLRFVVLVAGFKPRAAELAPLFDPPLSVPSLHIWGTADPFAKHGPRLFDHFSPDARQLLEWPGRHTVPTTGSAADALVEFVRRHA